jgi:hypothetical protein
MTHPKVTKERFLDELKQWSLGWSSDIDKSLERNLTLFGSSLGERGEYFASLISGKSGTGSGGSGFDLSDGVSADESKFACLVQPKHCNTCKQQGVSNTRIIFFYDKCPKCQGDDFTYVYDTRWGVDAFAGVQYKSLMENYWLQVLEPKVYHGSCRTFVYKCYKVLANDPKFSEYLTNQLQNGSKNLCNLLPYSFDFYRFSPIKVAEIEIDITTKTPIVTDIFWNLENTDFEVMPLTGKFAPNITIEESKVILENLGIDNLYPYTTTKSKSWSTQDKILTNFQSEREYLLQFIQNSIGDKNPADLLTLRSKSLGKDRGETKRAID